MFLRNSIFALLAIGCLAKLSESSEHHGVRRTRSGEDKEGHHPRHHTRKAAPHGDSKLRTLRPHRKLDDETRRKLAERRYLAAPHDRKIPGEYTIQFVPGQEQHGRAMVKRLVQEHPGAKVLASYSDAILGVSIGGIAKADMKKFLHDNVEALELVEEDCVVHKDAATTLWGLDRIDDESGFDNDYTVPGGLDGSGVDIYILDTGVDVNHNEFSGRIGGSHSTVPGETAGWDGDGHGTHVAGTAAGTTYGVAKKARIFGVKVLDRFGGGTSQTVIDGINWVMRHNNGGRPKVINMSLGGSASETENTAVENAVKAGVVVVVAAGNEDQNACNTSPASATDAITVASSTRSDSRSDFSNWGSCVDIFAPGSDITSSLPNGSSATWSGTSMASPHVAGAAALYLQKNLNAAASSVESALENLALNNRISDVKGSPNKLLYVGCIDGSCGSNPPTDPTDPTDPPPTDGTCQDTAGFVDSGTPPYTCADYEMYYDEGDCFDAHWFPNNGVTAIEACCWCAGTGGGGGGGGGGGWDDDDDDWDEWDDWQCSDDPINFSDSRGYTCADYESLYNQYDCYDAWKYSDWFGYTADWACCWCGGGW